MVIDLNGKWKFRAVTENIWHNATVPGCVHADLYANGLIPDPFFGANELELDWIERTDFEYCREFFVPAKLLEHRIVELVAEGLDTVAQITINGTLIASTDNMFQGYRFDVRQSLVAGPNTIGIRFRNPLSCIRERRGFTWFDQPNDPVGGASAIRKMQCSFGWDWGPRLPTCGIYRTICIEAFSTARIDHVTVRQLHESSRATISIAAEISGSDDRNLLSLRSSLSLYNVVVSQSTSNELVIDDPQLWWPSGHGAQPLYDLAVELLDRGGKVVDMWTRRIGLRTVTLDRTRDRWGESFCFIVNGRPVYAKGASWIPANALPSAVTGKTYEDLVRSAAEANFNMLRVWGGGLYEHECFYDLCDVYGIMVWHDFMFACSLYPADEPFMESVEGEARYQVRRLAHHACMALWCGNNELEYLARQIVSSQENRTAYERIFNDILPRAVNSFAPHISYWPSSPHNPDGYEHGTDNEGAGDHHYWDVWHGRMRPQSVERLHYRFWSEFGMQSYCSVDTALMFAKEHELNVYGPVMDNHQKHPAGNAIVMEYISYRYRFPKDFAALSYLSQINQAYCVELMVEHQRSCMPRTMGSLYWQLNDCWPAFSWSGIEFGGQWKALHYAARRFYAPALVTFRLIGEERAGKINRRINTISGVEIITAFDGPCSMEARLHWDLFTIDRGNMVLHGESSIVLEPDESSIQKRLDLSTCFQSMGRENLVMRLLLVGDTGIIARNSLLFTAPRFIELPKAPIVPDVKKTSARRFSLVFRGSVFQHQVAFHIPGVRYRASDNYFDLFPGTVHSIDLTIEGDRDVSLSWLEKNLYVTSVAWTY